MLRFSILLEIAITLLIVFVIPHTTFAQSYNSHNVDFCNYLVRMYENSPFEGVRVVEDVDGVRLISVLSLSGKESEDISVLNKIALIKAMSQVNRYLNGADISTDTVIKISNIGGVSSSEIVENIREKSIGYVRSMEQLTNFVICDGRVVFIFSAPLPKK